MRRLMILSSKYSKPLSKHCNKDYIIQVSDKSLTFDRDRTPAAGSIITTSDTCFGDNDL